MAMKRFVCLNQEIRLTSSNQLQTLETAKKLDIFQELRSYLSLMSMLPNNTSNMFVGPREGFKIHVLPLKRLGSLTESLGRDISR